MAGKNLNNVESLGMNGDISTEKLKRENNSIHFIHF